MFTQNIKSKLALVTALLVCSVGTAQAIPTWSHVYDPADVKLYKGDKLEYTHNILLDGYSPGSDTVTYASLHVWLYDDAFFGDIPWIGDPEEEVKFKYDSSGWSGDYDVDSIFWISDLFSFTVTSYVTDGLLNVALKATKGDFVFAGSKLKVWGEKASVPEPATLALFGLGLLGAGFGTRRRKQIAA